MSKQMTALALAGALSASPALASTITLDFIGGTNVGAMPIVGGTSATWIEDGFTVDWSMVDFTGPVTPDFNGFRNMSNSGGGAGPNGTIMTIKPQNGGTFGLSEIDTAWTYEGQFAQAELRSVGPDGTINFFSPPETFFAPVLREQLKVTGTKADGTTVTAYGTTASPDTYGPLTGFGPAKAMFDPDELASMFDLVSMSIIVSSFTTIHDGAVRAFREFGAPPNMLAAAEECGFLGIDQYCSVPEIGAFMPDIVRGGRNDTQAVGLSSITLTAPVPVPLPATALLMLGALGGLMVVRRRKS